MAEIKVPIQVNLPDDWVEQIIERLRNDPEAERVEIIRCGDCKHADYGKRGVAHCMKNGHLWEVGNYCSYAERKTDEQDN